MKKNKVNNYNHMIVLITYRLPPPFAGASTRAWFLTKELLNLFKDQAIINVIEIVPTNNKYKKYLVLQDMHNRVKRFMKTISILNIIKTMINKARRATIIASNPPYEAVLIGNAIQYRTGKTDNKLSLIADIQDITDEYRYMEARALLKGLYKLAYSYFYKTLSKYDYVFSVTEPMAQYLERRIKKKVYVAYNGVNMELYEHIGKYLKKPICNNDRCYLVFLGDLNWKYQRVDRIIKMVWILRNKYKQDIRLKVIGKGRYLDYYRQLTKALNLQKYVKFYGYVDYKYLPDIIMTSDIGIVGRPSIRNTWIITSMRMSIYEYLAGGLPIYGFGPPISYTKFFIKKHKVGVYVGSDDPHKLSEEFIERIEYIKSIKRRHCNSVASNYDWRKTLSPILKVIREELEK